MYRLTKSFKNPIIKTEKKQSKQIQIAVCEQNPLIKRIFLQTPFSLYFKIRAKNFHALKPLAFLLHFLFQREQNYHQFDFQKSKQRHTTIQNIEHGNTPSLTLQL